MESTGQALARSRGPVMRMVVMQKVNRAPYVPMMDWGGEPCVTQGDCAGWGISWNPDDGRWYVNHPRTGETMTHQKYLRNAVQWCRKNKVDAE